MWYRKSADDAATAVRQPSSSDGLPAPAVPRARYLHLGGQRTMRKSAEKDFKASRVLTASEECLEVTESARAQLHFKLGGTESMRILAINVWAVNVSLPPPPQ